MSRTSAITPHVRRLAAKGWSAPSIASAYGVTVRTVLDILNPRPRPFRLAPKRTPQWRDEWKQPGWRFRDDVGVEPAAPPGVTPLAGSATELVTDQAGETPPGSAAAIPAIEVCRPAPEAWSGPASPCQTSLKGWRRIKD